MINREGTEKLIHNARLNRGFWIGFFADPLTNNPVSGLFPERPHVTLAHLGRQVTDETVQQTVEALNAHGPHVVAGEVTGMGYFWRMKEPTIVALVNSAGMFQARSAILGKLAKFNVPFDERFGFIPHITLKADADQIFAAIRQKPFKVNFTLGVCCGDDTILV